jgi:hypothetical protein
VNGFHLLLASAAAAIVPGDPAGAGRTIGAVGALDALRYE